MATESDKSDNWTSVVYFQSTHRPGITTEEVVKGYTDWAKSYDKDIQTGAYHGAEIAAQRLQELYEPSIRGTLLVLDVAAGTGLVGEELFKGGFRRIDALEPSKGMLEVLQRRGVYSTTYETAIGSGATLNVIAANLYDVLVISGGMGEGHIPSNAVYEMIRSVKLGGTIVIVMREEYLYNVAEYAGFDMLMDALETRGFWRQLSRTIVPEYSSHKPGVVYTYQVTSDDYPI